MEVNWSRIFHFAPFYTCTFPFLVVRRPSIISWVALAVMSWIAGIWVRRTNTAGWIAKSSFIGSTGTFCQKYNYKYKWCCWGEIARSKGKRSINVSRGPSHCLSVVLGFMDSSIQTSIRYFLRLGMFVVCSIRWTLPLSVCLSYS